MSFSQHWAVKGQNISSAEATFYDAWLAAEVLWQVTDKSTPALAKAADIAKHRSIVQAAVGQPHLGGPSRAALRALTGAEV